jgi:hypothetical protein
VPTLWSHGVYFNVSSTAAPPEAPYRSGGYPTWQASGFAAGSGLGGAVVLWERAADWCRWFWTVFRRTWGYDPERRRAVLKALNALDHPAYPLAKQAVRKTATTLGFNRPEAWKDLSRELKSSAGHAENAYRHLEACRLVRANLISSTVSNPQCHLIVELAYHGWAQGK